MRIHLSLFHQGRQISRWAFTQPSRKGRGLQRFGESSMSVTFFQFLERPGEKWRSPAWPGARMNRKIASLTAALSSRLSIACPAGIKLILPGRDGFAARIEANLLVTFSGVNLELRQTFGLIPGHRQAQHLLAVSQSRGERRPTFNYPRNHIRRPRAIIIQSEVEAG